MIPSISRYSNTHDLLRTLGSSAIHQQTHTRVIDAWGPLPHPAPGADATEALADHLEEPLWEFAPDLSLRRRSRPVWQCALLTHPESTPLTDERLREVARRILQATGIAPDGDPAACRWIALRRGDHDLRIIAPLMRHDGRVPDTFRDRSLALAVCHLLEPRAPAGPLRTSAALVTSTLRPPSPGPAPHGAARGGPVVSAGPRRAP